MKRTIAGLLLVFGCSAASAQHAPHEHGVAELRVAVAGNTMQIEFESPLDNLVGFEHAPRTDAERQSLAAAGAALKSVERVVSVPAAAGCAVVSTQLEQPFAEHEDRGHDDGHAEMAVTHVLQCAKPAALDRLEIRLFALYPRLRQIRAERASPRGQTASTLTAEQRMLDL